MEIGGSELSRSIVSLVAVTVAVTVAVIEAVIEAFGLAVVLLSTSTSGRPYHVCSGQCPKFPCISADTAMAVDHGHGWS